MLNALRNRLSRTGAGASADAEALLSELAEARAAGDPQAPGHFRRLRALRHRAAVGLIGKGEPSADVIRDFGPLDGEGLASAPAADLDGGLVRGGILEHGYVLVRGMIDAGDAERMAGRIDAAFAARERDEAPSDLYQPFDPDPPYGSIGGGRAWVGLGGGLLAADSPPLLEEMFELLDRAGLRRVVGEFLGDTPMVSAEKCTLRKAMPGPPGGWHQDGSFIQTTRALNVWVALSDCGSDAPGLDFVPRRIDELVETGGEGSGAEHLERPEGDKVSPKTVLVGTGTAEDAAGEAGIARPEFHPGDVMLFDDRFLHRTGSEPEMPNPRYAIESWFFATSSFPGNYTPLVF